ncbi:MAG: hypothetical protein JWM57_178, partial [Phycisphaerales bacterium]|nr:hypothetical protein [Phycisphaerales bacterium]
RGGRPDVLLSTALPFCNAINLRTTVDQGWTGGSGRLWDNLANASFEFAKTSTDPTQQKLLIRSALLLGAQDRLNAGGFVHKIVRDPAFYKLSGLSARQSNDVLATVSAAAADTTKLAYAFLQWSKSSPSSFPQSLSKHLSTRPWLQWYLANYIASVKSKDPSRAETLIASARDGNRLPIFETLIQGLQQAPVSPIPR